MLIIKPITSPTNVAAIPIKIQRRPMGRFGFPTLPLTSLGGVAGGSIAETGFMGKHDCASRRVTQPSACNHSTFILNFGFYGALRRVS